MSRMKEYLIDKGIDAEIINNPAIEGLLADADKVLESALESKIEIVNADSTHTKVRVRDMEGKIILEINPVLSKHFSYNIYGCSKSFELDDYNNLKVCEEYGNMEERRHIIDRRFAKNGLEIRLSETLFSPFNNRRQVIKDVYREPNGYVAYVSGCNVDPEDYNLPVIEHYKGYVNLDLRYNTMVNNDLTYSLTANASNLAGTVPHKVEGMPDHPAMSPEAIEFIQKGINDNSEEERKRWEQNYGVPFSVTSTETMSNPLL